MKVKIRIDTLTDANNFVSLTNTVNGKVIITDNNGLTVNAKSILGALHAMEFNNLWCVSDEDIYSLIKDFVIIE